MALADLQSWMQEALRYPGEVDHQKSRSVVSATDRLSSEQRLAIYQRSYYERLLTCMSEQFRALSFALGQDLFRDFARDYLMTRPPSSYTLYDLGQRFPDHLEAVRPDRDVASEEKEIWIDFMIELCRFELMVVNLFDAPGHEGKPFASIETDDAQLRLQPCLRLGAFRFAVAPYYHAVRDGLEPEFPDISASYVMLVRKNFVTHTFSILPWQYRFLRILQSGQTVGEALEHIADETSTPLETAERAWQTIRTRWIEAHIFVSAN